jgi:HAD superfamily hydrolase (TIGR01493 family)
LLAYADNEAAVERETPSALYPDVLAMAFRRTGEKLSTPVSDAWAQRLGDSVPDWPAFPDSADALARLAQHYKLIILSNVHRAGFAASNQRLRGEFAAIITAEDVGAYKPAEKHFRALDATLPGLGVDSRACYMSRRACSTTTSRPSGKVCRRSGSTAATTAPVGERPRNPPQSGRSTWSSARWLTSQTLSTDPSPTPDYVDVVQCHGRPLRPFELHHFSCRIQQAAGLPRPHCGGRTGTLRLRACIRQRVELGERVPPKRAGAPAVAAVGAFP